jgi:YesN/AraC family two-component response regulator
MNKHNINPKNRFRVLIADDFQEMRRSTRLMLAENPLVEVVAIAHNGLQAVDMAHKQQPDIAILDINMPEMDGLSAIQAILKTNPAIGCIVISAERDSYSLRKAMSVGAREYLIKPFTGDELNQAVQRIIQHVTARRKRNEDIVRLRTQQEYYLKQLAQEYVKSRRTDDQAIQVFEELASNPHCELRWLTTLGMIYIIRRKWSKLKKLAERLEIQSN